MKTKAKKMPELGSIIGALLFGAKEPLSLAEIRRVTTSHALLSVPREPIWRMLNFLRGKYWSSGGNTPGHLQHWSRRGLFDADRTLWGGWAVRIGEFNSYFAGDTGYHDSYFRDIGERLGPFRLAMIPIGAKLRVTLNRFALVANVSGCW